MEFAAGDETAASGASGTLLIYISVPLHGQDGQLFLEDQACNGLRLWAGNFARLLVLVPLRQAPPPPSWVPVETVGAERARIELLPLPAAYRPLAFLRALPAALPVIRDAIARADYLGFAIGGIFGDWGSVGALVAHRLGRPFYVWTDRVESAVTRAEIRSAAGWRRRLQARLLHRPMAWYERQVIRRAALGLFHGRETYDAYAPLSPNPHVVHDIHIRRADHIPPGQLAQKRAGAAGGPLRICYVGRADAMKGPWDWLSVLGLLAERGVAFEATWLGTGSEHAAMQAAVGRGPLAGRVRLPGFVRDRNAILATLRDAHLMLFCHKTPESPRCLIEALTSGCPIVGYDSAFPRELIEPHGGGLLTPRNDVPALAAAVEALAQDRPALQRLIAAAARDGARFDDVSVFRHRSELIKRHLPPPRPDPGRPRPPAGTP